MDMNGFSHTFAVENEWTVVEGSSDFTALRAGGGMKEREEVSDASLPLSLSLSLSPWYFPLYFSLSLSLVADGKSDHTTFFCLYSSLLLRVPAME